MYDGIMREIQLAASYCYPDVIITRHRGLVDLLREAGIDDVPVIEHATADDVRGKDVWGVLPMWLAAGAATVTEISLRLRPEDRGRDLNAEETAERFAGITTYEVFVKRHSTPDGPIVG